MVRLQGGVAGVNIILGCQEVWGLCAQDHQVVNFFHLVVVFAPEKQPRKRASDTVIWVLQRGAKAEDRGEGSVPRRPHRVPRGYVLAE